MRLALLNTNSMNCIIECGIPLGDDCNLTFGTFILKELVRSARQNSNLPPTRYRYSEEIQWFSTYVFLLCGRSAYEFLSYNLPIPSVSTTRNHICFFFSFHRRFIHFYHDYNNILFSFFFKVSYIQKRKQIIVEGQLRSKELADYLDLIGAEKKVWLSEDGSGIVSDVTYDATTNQLVGLVLPYDKNGIPISFSYTPNAMSEIKNQMDNNARSTLVYVILAQPIKDNALPFILQVYGTNNKFKSNDVMQRWLHTKDQLAK